MFDIILLLLLFFVYVIMPLSELWIIHKRKSKRKTVEQLLKDVEISDKEQQRLIDKYMNDKDEQYDAMKQLIRDMD